MDIDSRRLDSLIRESIKEIEKRKGNFCISTRIPHEWLIEEEENWDRDMEYTTIKSTLNRKIIGKIIKETKKEYNPANPNIRITYDLKNYRFEIKEEPMFIFGRYEKYSREISQTRWICRKCNGRGCMHCDDKGKHYLSIEEIMGERFKQEFKCKDYFLHASGREDVNVENHAGRPFVIQLVEPKNIDGDLEKIEKELEKDGRVKVRDLRIVGRGFVELVGNSHFNKSYIAEIECEKDFTGEDAKKIKELKGVTIEQLTPHRVKHRRADLTRKRKILDIEILNYKKNKMEIEVTTEPGTYIKELIHSDEGRTKPSISELIGKKTECKKLTVSRIFDGFLNGIKN